MPNTNYTEWRDTPDDNRVRDVEVELFSIFPKYPTMSFVTRGPRPSIQHKHEWFQYTQRETNTTLTGDITSHAANATGITIAVDDDTIFALKDQVIVDGLEPIYQVTALPGSGNITVKEIRGRALSITSGTGAIARINRGVIEGSAIGTAKGVELASMEYNYTQIFRRDFKVTESFQETARLGGMYTLQDAFREAGQQRLREIAWEMNNAVMSGVRIERQTSEDTGMLGGIRNYVDDGSGNGNVISASGALTLTLMNSLAREIYDDMSNTSALIVVAPPGLSQTMATFLHNAAQSSITVNDPGVGRTFGDNVRYWIPDVSGMSPMEIVVDQNMPSNEVWMLDPSQIQLIPLGALTMKEYQFEVPGTRALSGTIVGEYTLVVRDGNLRHGMIKNITV